MNLANYFIIHFHIFLLFYKNSILLIDNFYLLNLIFYKSRNSYIIITKLIIIKIKLHIYYILLKYIY